MRIHKVLPFLLAVAALPAEATTTYYCSDATCGANTQAAFNAAFGALLTAGLTSTGTVNFTGATSGVTVSNVAGTGTNFTGFNNALPSTLNVVGSQLQNTSSGAGSGIGILLPAGVFAFGAHVTQPVATMKFYCFEANPGDCDVNFTLVSGIPAFVGIISDVPLPALQLRDTGTASFLFVNDFILAETPEASTFVMVGTGLILFAMPKRKKRRVEQSLEC